MIKARKAAVLPDLGDSALAEEMKPKTQTKTNAPKIGKKKPGRKPLNHERYVFYLPQEIGGAIKEQAKEEGRTESGHVALILKRHLDA